MRLWITTLLSCVYEETFSTIECGIACSTFKEKHEALLLKHLCLSEWDILKSEIYSVSTQPCSFFFREANPTLGVGFTQVSPRLKLWIFAKMTWNTDEVSWKVCQHQLIFCGIWTSFQQEKQKKSPNGVNSSCLQASLWKFCRAQGTMYFIILSNLPFLNHLILI